VNPSPSRARRDAERASRASAVAYVYFLHAPRQDWIKIGCSRSGDFDRPRRVAGGLPFETLLLGIVPGAHMEETELHRRFASARVRECTREWYFASKILVEVTEILATQRVELLSGVCPRCGKTKGGRASLCFQCSTVRSKRRYCADCGAAKPSTKSLCCRTCAGKRRSKAHRLETVAEEARFRATCVCLGCGVQRSASAVRARGKKDPGLCRSCAMRKAWASQGYQESIMAARQREGLRRRKRCEACGEPLAPGRDSGTRFHPECWRRKQEAGHNSPGERRT
jgi:hypothetical protein